MYGGYLSFVLKLRWPVVTVYLLVSGVFIWLMFPRLGTEIFPTVDAGQFQLRLRAPTGTRIERTELVALKALDVIKREAGEANVEISSGFIGVQPASYPINTIYLWTSGPHEAVLLVALKPSATLRGEALKERLRAKLKDELPGTLISFEAGDIVSNVMSFGSPTPIEVAVQGPALPANRAHAEKVLAELAKIPELRDLQYGQALDYPTIDVNIDRERAGLYGLTMSNVAKSLVAATTSSRFIEPNYWRDPVSGNAFQIQVEIPQHRMASIEDMSNLPVMNYGEARPLLGDVATLKLGTAMGVVERYNMQRVVSLTANVYGKPLGDISGEIRKAIARAGEIPRGITVNIRGQIPALNETIGGLQTGMLLAIGVIFLLLTANFQSLRMAIAVIMTVPAVICGVIISLLITGSSLNVQSFMGAIMAVGIAVANSILLVTFAEMSRKEGASVLDAALEGGRGRMRAILMTASAMIAGMIPIAMGQAQTAPLGRAVIGGLVFATIATLTVLPSFYAVLQSKNKADSSSLDPDDPTSKYYERT